MGTTSKTKRTPDFKTNRWLKQLYNELNHDFFDNKLPKRVRVIWSADVEHRLMGKTMWRPVPAPQGSPVTEYEPYEIRISNRLKRLYLQRPVGMLMVHEMNHIKKGLLVSCEEFDGEFDKSMFELCAKGAFQTFW